MYFGVTFDWITISGIPAEQISSNTEVKSVSLLINELYISFKSAWIQQMEVYACAGVKVLQFDVA